MLTSQRLEHSSSFKDVWITAQAPIDILAHSMFHAFLCTPGAAEFTRSLRSRRGAALVSHRVRVAGAMTLEMPFDTRQNYLTSVTAAFDDEEVHDFFIDVLVQNIEPELPELHFSTDVLLQK
ncbi:unnamed protein product [Prorocentrum cordatum]|uniref:Uncharacterized protein n=1 Tax=Prorocentrum cordatum TaxID=2364126 RepID=A0ABN9UIN4_9DINO|nr:unnamed protein product [Polarella glacialis]